MGRRVARIAEAQFARGARHHADHLVDGPIVPLIAETGGINAMLVDATALPEQVADDVVTASITGPTWVAGSRGSPRRNSRAAPATMPIILSAT
jgi:delta 1-pyrroline-5-carboxylate dehydrogenase